MNMKVAKKKLLRLLKLNKLSRSHALVYFTNAATLTSLKMYVASVYWNDLL